jgi:hypothetical protein
MPHGKHKHCRAFFHWRTTNIFFPPAVTNDSYS